MKFTLKRGLFRLITTAAAVLICLPAAECVAVHIICMLFCAGWLVCWTIGGFFNME